MKQKPKEAGAANPKPRKGVVVSEPAAAASEPPEVPAPGAPVTAVSVETPVPHLLVRMVGVVDESSVTDFFRTAGEKIRAVQAKRVLVDLRECKVTLSISDMHGLAKLVASDFSGTVERLSVLMQERDILPEKFFEPALTSRGLPTRVTSDHEDAVYWLSTKLRP
jgi:hypothetical protein